MKAVNNGGVKLFCSRCGNELNNGDGFCPKCGFKIKSRGEAISVNISTENFRDKIMELKENIVLNTADLGKNRLFIFGNIALLILSIIFACTPIFKVSSLFGISESMSMFVDINGIRVFFISCYIISIIFIIIPLVSKKAWKSKYFLMGKITSILMLIWFLIVLISGISKTEESSYGSIAEFSLTATGWLFLIFTIGSIILLFKTSYDIKKGQKSEDNLLLVGND